MGRYYCFHHQNFTTTSEVRNRQNVPNRFLALETTELTMGAILSFGPVIDFLRIGVRA